MAMDSGWTASSLLFFFANLLHEKPKHASLDKRPGGGGVLPYMGYIGMCRCEGCGFQAVYCRIGYINQNIWV